MKLVPLWKHSYQIQRPYLSRGAFLHRAIWSLNAGEIGKSGFNMSTWTPALYAGVSNPPLAFGFPDLKVSLNTAQPLVNEVLKCTFTFCINEYNRSIVGGTLVSNIVATEYGHAVLNNSELVRVCNG